MAPVNIQVGDQLIPFYTQDEIDQKLTALGGQPPAPPPPPPAPEPPAPPPAPVQRTKPEITAIIVSEFAKQTSFLPGGQNGSATEAEVNDPKRAIQAWVENAILNLDALLAPESELRAGLASLISKDVAKFKWAENYPPKASEPPAAPPPAPVPQDPPVVSPQWPDSHPDDPKATQPPPDPNPITKKPTIKILNGTEKIIGVDLERVSAEAVGGWTPMQGRWYEEGESEPEGSQGRFNTLDVNDGKSVMYREWWTDGKQVVITESDVLGPFKKGEIVVPPPSPGGKHWDAAQMAAALQTSTGSNELKIKNINPDSSWKGGSADAMGNLWNGRDMPWTWPMGGMAGRPDEIWPDFEWWGVTFRAQDDPNTEEYWEVKDMDIQFVLKGQTEAFRPVAPRNTVNWIEMFKDNMIDSTGRRPQVRSGADHAGASVLMDRSGGNAHWTCGRLRDLPYRRDIDVVMTSMMVRLDPRGPMKARYLAHVGADPKHNAGGMHWWPGYGVSNAILLKPEWRKVVKINVVGRNGSNRRLISRDRFNQLKFLN